MVLDWEPSREVDNKGEMRQEFSFITEGKNDRVMKHETEEV